MCLFMNISLSGWNGCSLFCWNLLVKNSIHSKHIHEKYLYSDANYLDLMQNMKINLNQTYCVISCFVTYFRFGIYRTKKWPKKMFEFWWYCVCQIWHIYQDCYIFSLYIPGIRGELNMIVKVDLFSDVNKFRQSSCGIQFFSSECFLFLCIF